MAFKPTLCIDFHGVIHSHKSKAGPLIQPDPPVPGAFDFIQACLPHFKVNVFSVRSPVLGGTDDMKQWFIQQGGDHLIDQIHFPFAKPRSFLSIDDRALQFEGVWWDPQKLLQFKPWNKK